MKSETLKKTLYLIAILLVFGVIMFSLFNARIFGEPKNSDMDDYFIANGQEETGANNIVTAVVFDYRGFDTLGEASVLFAAVLSVAILFDFKIKTIKKEKTTKGAKQ
jgi:multisubunit Na+/H+ antiporter MnhB subunit